MNKRIIPLFSSILFLGLFLYTTPAFNQIEMGIYSSYVESIVEDGDLNIFDEMNFPGQKTVSSSTYYYPTFVSHGGVVFWAPGYIYGRVIAKIFDAPEQWFKTKLAKENSVLHKPFSFSYGTDRFLKHIGMSMTSPLFIALFSLLFLLFIRENYFDEIDIKEFCLFFLLVFFGTPTALYTTLDPGNGAPASLFLTFSFVYFYKKIRDEDNLLLWMSLGIFHSISFSVRVEVLFYLAIFGEYLYVEFKQKKKLEKVKNLIAFAFAWGVGISLQFLNIYKSLGTFTYGYSKMGFRDVGVLYDTYFSPYQGVIFTSPLILLGLVLLVSKIKKTFLEDFRFYIAIGIIVKVIVFGLTYSHGSGVFGGRQFISEFPWVFLGLYLFYKNNLKTKISRSFFFVLLFILCGWNIFLMVFFFGQEVNILPSIPYANTARFYLETLFNNSESYFKTVLRILDNTRYFREKFLNFFPLISFYVLLIFLINTFLIKSFKKVLYSFSMYLLVSYSIVTALNVINGNTNVAEMKNSDYFKNTVVGNGPIYSVYYENMGSIEERIEFLKENKRFDELESFIHIKNKIDEKVEKNIIRYPKDYKGPIRLYYREFMN